MDSVWAENPPLIPKYSLRNHCIDRLRRQVFEQLCCAESRIRIHKLKARGQATDHCGRIQPGGTEWIQTRTGLTFGEFLAKVIPQQRTMPKPRRVFTQGREQAALGR